VVPNAIFELRVRLRDASRRVLPDQQAAGVIWNWTPNSALKIDPVSAPATGAAIRVHATIASGTVTITAKHPGIATPATTTIIVGGAGAQPTTDWVLAPHNDFSPPLFAIVDGSSTSWRDDDLYAVVGSNAMDKFRAGCNPTNTNCGRVAVFSRDFSAALVDVAWKAGCDIVMFESGVIASDPDANPFVSCTQNKHPLQSAVPIPAVFYRATNASMGMINAHIAYAKDVLSKLPLGLTFNPTVNAAAPMGVELTFAGAKCDLVTPGSGLRWQLQTYGGLPDAAFEANQLLIVYVQTIKAGSSWYPGFTCPADGTNGPIALIGADQSWHSTLVHELAHGLGPWPNWLHVEVTDIAGEFDGSNIMSGGEVDYSATNRRIFTLGQIYRIAFGQGALMDGLLGTTAVACQAVASGSEPCPRLSKDHHP
jgi:hypothetical protein